VMSLKRNTMSALSIIWYSSCFIILREMEHDCSRAVGHCYFWEYNVLSAGGH
jgi:hypothetical protein